MDHSPHHESQQAADDSPVSPQSSSGLFPPYYPERTTSPSRSNTPSSEQRAHSQASNKITSQVYTQGVIGTVVGDSMPKKKSLWQKIPNILPAVLNRGWSIEYISCLISVTAFVSIIIVLNRYDQKAMPSWPMGITLNTLLAFLTAVSQTCFVQPVVQGLSQMKWNWFASKSRPLADFESFDNASRGAWGSILLVFSTKGRLSVLLAAVILVTSAVTSTITQAALSQGTKYVPGTGNATAERLINDTDFQMKTVNQAMAVMMNAMYTSANSTYKFDAPVCPTGNCDWPTFGSLAVCSQTNDITDQLRTSTGQTQVCWQNSTANKLQPWNWGPPVCQNITYSGLPNGLYLDYFSGNFQANTSNIWLSAKGDPTAWSKVYSFDNDTFGPNALNAVQVVYLDSLNESYYNTSSEVPTLPNSTVFLNHSRASETLFYLCAQTYDVSIKNGTAMTAINATSHSINDTQSVTVTDDSGHYNIYTYHTFILDGQNYSYHILDWDLGNMLNEFANGHYSQDASGGGLGSDTPFSYAVGNALYQTVNVNTPNATGDGLMRQALSGMVDNMAKGLTNWLRSRGTGVAGHANSLEVYVVVRWNFMVFLGVQVLLSAAFLVWIVADSKLRKTKILKESALATLLAVPGSDREYLESLLSATEEGELGLDQKEDIKQNSRARLIKDGITGQWSLKVVDGKV